MAKLSKKIVGAVGLSYCLQSHRKKTTYAKRNYFKIQHNTYTNEIRIQPKSVLLNSPVKMEHDRGKRSGKLFIEGLTPQARHKIQKASRVLENVYKHEPKLKAYCSMLTLSYGKDFPSDHDSKKHLDTFLKRLRRLHPDCKYLWVAEKQKRGAIHYHILTPYYTKKEWLNNAWNQIVGKWQSQNNLPLQTVLPNVIKVFQAGSYLAKYLQKEGQNIGGNGYGIDTNTRELMKDESIYFVTHDLEHNEVNEVVNELIKDVTQNQEKTYAWNSKQSGYVGAWSSGYNVQNLTEWIKYKRHEYNLMIEDEDTERRKGILQEIILDLKQ